MKPTSTEKTTKSPPSPNGPFHQITASCWLFFPVNPIILPRNVPTLVSLFGRYTMRYLIGLTLLALLAPALAAQEAPEQVFSAQTQFYLRWDGIDAHKALHAKTALGKTLAGDTGTFITSLFSQMEQGLGSLLTVQELLGGVPPEKLKQMQADANAASRLLPLLGKTGFLVAGELRKVEPLDGELTLILPNAGDGFKSLHGAIRLAILLNKGTVKETTIGKRTFFHAMQEYEVPVHLIWWAEGVHAVVQVGMQGPETVAKRLDDPKRSHLSDHTLFQRIKKFDPFVTSARAFVDAAALVKMAAARDARTAKLVDELGLNGLQSLVLYSGFAGEAERGLVELDIPGPRKGLLSLFHGKAFKLSDIPALPPDVVSWSATSLDLAHFYEVVVEAAEIITRTLSPESTPLVRGGIATTNIALGLDMKKDLLDNLADQVVAYNSPSEGPLTLGQVIMFKVKDADKLKEALPTLVKGIARLGGQEIMLKKRTYRGTEVREVHVKQQGFFFVPTYTIHKGWLCISLFPQSVHGYIARSNNDMAGFKPSTKVKGFLDSMPREGVSFSYSDPRPSIKQILSLGPTIGGLVLSFNPETNFEVGSIPNAQDATRLLFPNLSVSTVDDKTLRIETRSSLPLPLDAAGIDTYGIFILLTFGRLVG
jgi:hypothetical protein